MCFRHKTLFAVGWEKQNTAFRICQIFSIGLFVVMMFTLVCLHVQTELINVKMGIFQKNMQTSTLVCVLKYKYKNISAKLKLNNL